MNRDKLLERFSPELIREAEEIVEEYNEEKKKKANKWKQIEKWGLRSVKYWDEKSYYKELVYGYEVVYSDGLPVLTDLGREQFKDEMYFSGDDLNSDIQYWCLNAVKRSLPACFSKTDFKQFQLRKRCR